MTRSDTDRHVMDPRLVLRSLETRPRGQEGRMFIHMFALKLVSLGRTALVFSLNLRSKAELWSVTSLFSIQTYSF